MMPKVFLTLPTYEKTEKTPDTSVLGSTARPCSHKNKKRPNLASGGLFLGDQLVEGGCRDYWEENHTN